MSNSLRFAVTGVGRCSGRLTIGELQGRRTLASSTFEHPKLGRDDEGTASIKVNQEDVTASHRNETNASLLQSTSPLLPPLNGLEQQIHVSSRKHSTRQGSSWKNMSYQCIQQHDSSSIPDHVVMECLQFWTRQRPIQKTSTSMTWKLLDVLLAKRKQSGDIKFSPQYLAIVTSVLDHWRLALQDGVAVSMTVKDALGKLKEWEKVNQPPLHESTTTDEDATIQKAYSILLKALSVTNEDIDLVDEILQSMPADPSTVTMNGALTVYAKRKSSQACERSKDLLRSMVAPNVISYACLLEALHNKGNAVQEAEEILEEMKGRGIAPNSICYLHYLRILTSSNQLARALETLEKLVTDYKTTWNTDAESNHLRSAQVVVPTRHLFSAIMSAYARKGDFNRVKQLLQELQSLYATSPRQQDKDLLMPTAATMNSVLEAYGNKRTLDGALEAVAILERLEDWGAQQHDTACLPDETSFNTVLDAWAEVARFYPDAVRQAEALLDRMMNHACAKPDAYSFTTIMKAWSRSDRSDSPERCQAYLDALWGLYDQERRFNVKPNDVTYATCIYAWSRVAGKRNEAPHKAEALFRDMKQRHENGDRTLKPSESIYVSLMTNWNRSITSQTKQLALARSKFYFDQMRAQYLAGDESMRPTANIYNALLEGMKQAGDGKGADRVFARMMDDYHRCGNVRARPNTYSFQSIMTAWARSKSPDAPLRAEALLTQMEDLHERLGWDCKPTSVAFASVLNCWATSGREEAPLRATAILRHMEKMHAAGRKDIKPNTYAYATVLDSWARSRLEDAPERAQALFEELQQRYRDGEASCRPSSAAYLALLSTWGRSSRRDGALKALAILNEMEDRHHTDGSTERADCIHFSAVINAFAERADEMNARALLTRITSSVHIRPHAACYNGLIKAITRSECSDAGERAETVLRDMQAGKIIRPDVVTYTSCITAWGYSKNSDSVDRAQCLLHECIAQSGSKSAAPNASTFLAFLRVLSKSDLPDKAKRARWAREQMKALGIRPTSSICLEFDKCFESR
ncbi:hypothetical protein MPSEU_000410600 [Mayamaea pseudoterrestris]|nr:hypothetical protein MPSEU_000410600 [Mayamaea pseudoterrestris]